MMTATVDSKNSVVISPFLHSWSSQLMDAATDAERGSEEGGVKMPSLQRLSSQSVRSSQRAESRCGSFQESSRVDGAPADEEKRESGPTSKAKEDQMEMPPKHLRVMEGPMEKEVLGRDGVKFQKRVATMTEERLCFSKVVHPQQASIVKMTESKALPASVLELQKVFHRHDADGNGTLDVEEATECLIELNLYSTAQDVSTLFQALDADKSGALDWDEFVVLARQASAANLVVDFIPLDEIELIQFELMPVVSEEDQHGGQWTHVANSRNAIPEALQDKQGRKRRIPGETDSEDSELYATNETFCETIRNVAVAAVHSAKSWLETTTGFDFDGDGNIGSEWQVPAYDPKSLEFHLIIGTLADGHNSGRTYVFRVPHAQAQDWFMTLQQSVRQAKVNKRQQVMLSRYGTSKYSMYRYKVHKMYVSNTFSYITAFLIIFAFFLDMVEAQLLPQKNTSEFWKILYVDATITTCFTVELFINIFAHSNYGFRPFYMRWSSWFDVSIVIVSWLNVILTASGQDFPNAKMLRLLRLGRAVRLFNSLKDLNRLITAVSSAMYPVCNAFLILFITSCVYGILGTNFFRDKEPEFFADFLTSLFTMCASCVCVSVCLCVCVSV